MKTLTKNSLESLLSYYGYGEDKISEIPAILSRKKEGKGIMVPLNNLLDGFGIERLERKDGTCLQYVNLGDTYSSTVFKDVRNGKYIISSIGDIVEKTPNAFK